MSIVVGYLDTAEGRTALEAATAQAIQRSERLVVVVSERPDGLDVDQRAAVEAALDQVRTRLQERGVEHDVRIVSGGRDVAEDLIGAAEDADASLIVIGLRRRSPVGKLILGVNAQRILLDSSCPVLAVKPDQS